MKHHTEEAEYNKKYIRWKLLDFPVTLLIQAEPWCSSLSPPAFPTDPQAEARTLEDSTDRGVCPSYRDGRNTCGLQLCFVFGMLLHQ